MDIEDYIEHWQERAAIMSLDPQVSVQHAEDLALDEVMRAWIRDGRPVRWASVRAQIDRLRSSV